MSRTNTSSAVLAASMLTAALTLASATNSYAARGGASASHISAQGLAHTNGPNAADRDFGRDRADDVKNSHAHARSSLHMHDARTSAHHRHMAISKWDTLTSL